jgi:hypothetical protein
VSRTGRTARSPPPSPRRERSGPSPEIEGLARHARIELTDPPAPATGVDPAELARACFGLTSREVEVRLLATGDTNPRSVRRSRSAASPPATTCRASRPSWGEHPASKRRASPTASARPRTPTHGNRSRQHVTRGQLPDGGTTPTPYVRLAVNLRPTETAMSQPRYGKHAFKFACVDESGPDRFGSARTLGAQSPLGGIQRSESVAWPASAPGQGPGPMPPGRRRQLT